MFPDNLNPKDSKSQGVDRLIRVLSGIEILIPYIGSERVNKLIEQSLDLAQPMAQTRLEQARELTQGKVDLELETLILNNTDMVVEAALAALKEALRENRVNSRLAFLKAAIKGRWKAKGAIAA